MNICYAHTDCVLIYDEPTCPVCRQLADLEKRLAEAEEWDPCAECEER